MIIEQNQAVSTAGQLRGSARKLNLVAQMIRGMHVSEALKTLTFSKKRIANEAKKTLKAAIANAENNHNLDIDALFVEQAFVGKSLTMKRFRAQSKGRAAPLKKRFSKLTIIVGERG